MGYCEDFEYEEFQYNISANIDETYTGYVVLNGETGEEFEFDGVSVNDVERQIKNLINEYIKTDEFKNAR